MSSQSVDQVAAAIASFEVSTGHKGFKTFHLEQARAFKRKLLESINPGSGKPLAKATIHARLMTLKVVLSVARRPTRLSENNLHRRGGR